MPRRRKAFKNKPVPPHEAAERILEAASQPVSTEAPDQTPDRMMRAIDEDSPERSDFERTMKDYYAQTDAEEQGGVPRTPPETDPLPLQGLERPKHPPRHNM
ncbi:MAG TPA: hypothetical protein VGK48_04630 [Terriglobia bacterium]|jgi:hypothetical protein